MISILNPKRPGADRSPKLSADAALRRLSKANMGWFRRSAKITVWRLTVHYSLTMPRSGPAPALTSIKVKAVRAGKY